ncbi:hypothetical protein NG54_07905 [Heyndrickxia ginsengihumi]|uniref:Fibronectin type-III domain-containing protein n=1 Tax=Heyndrickxia ginsengihumi TaxID=363870 RepID=A0A0A6VBT5_9BACI|nr:hypothetical protein NG54_07905 [Heyndrickxia ginsengihumi]
MQTVKQPQKVEQLHPNAPQNLQGTATVTTTDLSWDTVDGATYNVYRNDSKVASAITETSYYDTGLTGGTTYNYAVSAIVGGVESPKSEVLIITTQASGS